MSLDQVYSQQIKAWAQIGGQDLRLERFDQSLELRNPTCGSKVIVTLAKGPPLDLGIDARRACLLTQASAHALTLGPVDQVQEGLEALQSILSNTDFQDKAWQHLEVFAPVSSFRARHSSLLLPFKAVLQALQD